MNLSKNLYEIRNDLEIKNMIALNKSIAKKQVLNRHGPMYTVSVILLLYAVMSMYLSLIQEMFPSLVFYLKGLPLIGISLYLIMLLYFKSSKWNLKLWALAVYAVYSVVLCLMLGSGLPHILRLIVLLLSIMAYGKYPLSKRDKKALYHVLIFATIVVLINGAPNNVKISGKINPNLCAAFLMLLFCVSLARCKRAIINLPFIVACLCIVLQFVYVSRTALLGCILFALSFLIFRRRQIKIEIAFWLIFIISILGVVFAYLYSVVLFNAVGRGVKILGKDLFTGRQTIWQYTLESIRQNLLFGVGDALNRDAIIATGNHLLSNAHNQPLGTLAAYGIIHFVMFYAQLSYFSASTDTIKCGKVWKTHSYLIAFMVVILITSYFELYFFDDLVTAIIVAFGSIDRRESLSNVSYRNKLFEIK